MRRNKLISGQALLIVLLVMSVVLVLVLSVVARSVTDVTVSTQEEEASRAFSAAEAGVESVLTGGDTGGLLGNNSEFIVNFDAVAEGATEYNYPKKIASGESAIIWFVEHDNSGNLTCDGGTCFTGTGLTVYWELDEGGDAPDLAPAIEVSVYYKTAPWDFNDYSEVKIRRSAFDPGGRPNNNFSPPTIFGGGTVDGVNYKNGTRVSWPKCPTGECFYFVSIRMLYNTTESHNLGVVVDGVDGLPSQGKIIQSTGTAGDATRAVEVIELYPGIPPIFDAAIYSSNDIVKN